METRGQAQRERRWNPGRIIAGLVFILIGILLVIDRMDIADTGALASDLWPLLIVAFGVGMYFSRQTTRTAALIIIGIGLILFIAGLDVLPGSAWDWIWPLALIGVGIWIISTRFWESESSATTLTTDRVSSTTILGSSDLENASQTFRGGSLTTVLGDMKLNLHNARLAPEGARIDITTLLGDTEVRVPRDWAVNVVPSPILGDVKDETQGEPHPPDQPLLTIQATSILADIKIRRAV